MHKEKKKKKEVQDHSADICIQAADIMQTRDLIGY